METREEMEFRLWNYIDGEGTPEERLLIETLIREQAEWKATYGELLHLHGTIGLDELDEPSMRFTKDVMEAIVREQIAPAAKQYINQKLVWGLGLFFIAMMFGLIAYAFSLVNWSAGSTSSGPMSVDLGKVDYSPLFGDAIFNGFLMLNVVMGLFLLDRVLSRKRKDFGEFGIR